MVYLPAGRVAFINRLRLSSHILLIQAVVLVECFLEHGAPQDVAVRAFCVIFNRIVDLENIGNHLNVLAPQLRFEIAHRLGILNIWSAVTPGTAFSVTLVLERSV
jgi:hypothetical protein